MNKKSSAFPSKILLQDKTRQYKAAINLDRGFLFTAEELVAVLFLDSGKGSKLNTLPIVVSLFYEET